MIVLGARDLAAEWPAPAGTVTVDPMITALYGLLATAATGRATAQLAQHAGDAPLAYGLSAVAGAFYVVAGLALRRTATSPRATHVAAVICAAELVGVLAVGALTLAAPGLFPDDTVWSAFGMAYGFLPLVLPVLALVALRRGRADQGSCVDGAVRSSD